MLAFVEGCCGVLDLSNLLLPLKSLFQMASLDPTLSQSMGRIQKQYTFNLMLLHMQFLFLHPKYKVKGATQNIYIFYILSIT